MYVECETCEGTKSIHQNSCNYYIDYQDDECNCLMLVCPECKGKGSCSVVESTNKWKEEEANTSIRKKIKKAKLPSDRDLYKTA